MSLNTIPEIVEILRDTILSNAEVIELEIPESVDLAFAVEINPNNGCAAWDLLYSQIPKTGRYPVIVQVGNYYPVIVSGDTVETLPENWTKSISSADLFNRYSYEQEDYVRINKTGTSPQSIIERAKSFDLEKYIEAQDEEFLLWQFDEEEIEDILVSAVESIEEKHGNAPEIDELLKALGLSDRELGVSITGEDVHEEKFERWLFEWELANGNYEKAVNYEGKIYPRDWFYGNPQYAVILLPTQNSWESLAYIHWYGASPATECAMAFLKRWHDNYQAELVCHFGTVLHLNVGKLPQTPMEGFDLMVEQFTFSDYEMRDNFNMSDYARYLMKVNHWTFHERP
jgi:hypothetical protein